MINKRPYVSSYYCGAAYFNLSVRLNLKRKSRRNEVGFGGNRYNETECGQQQDSKLVLRSRRLARPKSLDDF